MKYLITKNDEIFFKRITWGFCHRILYVNNIDDLKRFKNETIKWIENFQTLLELMEKSWKIMHPIKP